MTIIETNRGVKVANEKMFTEWLVNDITEFDVKVEEFKKVKFYNKVMINQICKKSAFFKGMGVLIDDDENE